MTNEAADGGESANDRSLHGHDQKTTRRHNRRDEQAQHNGDRGHEYPPSSHRSTYPATWRAPSPYPVVVTKGTQRHAEQVVELRSGANREPDTAPELPLWVRLR